MSLLEKMWLVLPLTLVGALAGSACEGQLVSWQWLQTVAREMNFRRPREHKQCNRANMLNCK